MKIILASFLLVACGSAEQAKAPEVDIPNIAVATPMPTPTPAPVAPVVESEVAPDTLDADYAFARSQWRQCTFNAVFAACGRQPGTFSPGWERCKVNHSRDCGSEPVLTDFQ